MSILDDHYEKTNIIRERLGKIVDEKEVDLLLDLFSKGDYISNFLKEPKVLENLCVYLENHGIKEFNLLDFYEFHFKNIFSSEYGSISSDLEKVSLLFEKLETDRILFDKLDSFIKMSGTSLSREQLFDLNILYEFSMPPDNVVYVRLKHPTISEYFVSKYILESEDPLATFKSLVVTTLLEETEIRSSWMGVLTFLSYSKISKDIFEYLLSIIQTNPKTLNESISVALIKMCFKNNYDSSKDLLFNIIFNTYQSRCVWLPPFLADPLSKLVTKDSYIVVKNYLKPITSEYRNLIRIGNVLIIIKQLLARDLKFLTEEDREFWKSFLLNTVSQSSVSEVIHRICLSALSEYKDKSLVKKLSKIYYETNEDLLKQSFVRFALNTAPNDEVSIDIFTDAISNNVFYARHALYNITKVDSLKYLLNILATDVDVLKGFFLHSSIYAKKESGDIQLINNIKAVLDNDILELIKKIINNAVLNVDVYHGDEEYFIMELTKIVSENAEGYVNFVLDYISSFEKDSSATWKALYSYEHVLSLLLTEDNLDVVKNTLSSVHSSGAGMFQSIVYFARKNNVDGENIYAVALSKGFLPKDNIGITSENTEKESDPNKEVYTQFLSYLNVGEGRYSPQVYSYYVNNKDIIESYVTTEDINRLKSLALDSGLHKIDPKEIKINYQSSEKTGPYNISSIAEYFGNIIRVLNVLEPDSLLDNRQKLINYVPFAYYDSLSVVQKYITQVNDSELEWLLEIYMDISNDTRYLLPSSFIQFIEHLINNNSLNRSVIPVLDSFVEDKYISYNDTVHSLEVLGNLLTIKDKDYKRKMQYYFNEFKDAKDAFGIAETANSILISVYGSKRATNWRFKQLKKSAKPAKPLKSGVVHTVGPFRRELDTLSFAKPLINSPNIQNLDKIVELLKFSMILSTQGDDYWSYVNYLWKIINAYVKNLPLSDGSKALETLETWILSNWETYDKLNWFNSMLLETRQYLSHSEVQNFTLLDTLEDDNHV